jgi:hypothetical protein
MLSIVILFTCYALVIFSRHLADDIETVWQVEVLPVLRDLRNRVLNEHLEVVLSNCAAQMHMVGRGKHAPRPPAHFLCPISQTLMVDPVVASDGFVYERSSLTRWLEESATSPMTNSRLEESVVTEAVVLREAINRWRAMCSYAVAPAASVT